MLKQHKIVAALPSPLEADSIYYIRVGTGFDQYVTNGLGQIVAYPDNAKTIAEKAAADVLGKEPTIPVGTSAQFWSGAKSWVDFGNTVRSTVLTGVVLTNSAVISATDTFLAAMGKLQAQITARALKGANSDITSLSGLTTALSIAQGGTGQKTAAAALSALGGVPQSAVGVSIAQLINGTVPASQLPSFVDDVIEYASLVDFPATGETGKIYIATDTSRQYRWSGSGYIQLVASPGTTDNVPEGASNLYHTQDRVLSTILQGLLTGDATEVAPADSILAAFGKLQAQLGIKANTNSPKLTGVPEAPTAPVGTNNTQLATMAALLQGMAAFGLGVTQLATIADFNEVRETGLYRYSTASANSPMPTQSGTLIHLSYASTYMAQVAIHFGQGAAFNNQIFIRSMNSASWGAWYQIARLDSPKFTGIPLAPTAAVGTATDQIATMNAIAQGLGSFGLGQVVPVSDANTILKSGFYSIPTTTGGGLNGPPGLATIGFYILCWQGGSNHCVQIAGPATSVSTNKHRLWHRQNFGGTWSEWKEFADLDSPSFTGLPTVPTPVITDNSQRIVNSSFVNSLIGSLGIGPLASTQNLISAGVDLNTIQTPGFYGQAANSNATLALNYPTTLAGTLSVSSAGNGITTQRYDVYLGGRTFSRCRYLAAWGPWKEDVKTDSPSLLGTPTTTTPTPGNVSKQIANTEFLEARVLAERAQKASISGLIQSPGNSSAEYDFLTLTTTRDLPVGSVFEIDVEGVQAQSATNLVLSLYVKVAGGPSVIIGQVSTGAAAQSGRGFSGRGRITFTAAGASGSYLVGGSLQVSGIAPESSNSKAAMSASTLAGMTITVGVRCSVAGAENINHIVGATIKQVA